MDPGIKPSSLTNSALSDRFFTTNTTWEGLPLLYTKWFDWEGSSDLWATDFK